MSGCSFVRIGNTLRAADERAQREVNRLSEGEEARVEFLRPRSYGQLKFYWALCDLVAHNHSSIRSKEQVDQALRILTGHTDPLVDPSTGEIIALVPKRLNFRTMAQPAWEDYLDKAKKVVCERLLPGVTSAKLEQEILNMMTY